MYRILNIENSNLERFIDIESVEDNKKLKVFDDSRVAAINGYDLEVEGRYHMNLLLCGSVTSNNHAHKYGKKIKFKIIKNEFIGTRDLFLVQTDTATFYIPVTEETQNIFNSQSKKGYYNYVRIDIIQVDDIVHPDYL